MEVIDPRMDDRRKTDVESAERPRLLDLHAAGEYLGLSYWTIRDWVLDGIIPAVKLPCGRQRRKGKGVVRRSGFTDARRILLDRADLDRLIENSKVTA